MASVLERRTLTVSVKMKLWFWGAVDVLFFKINHAIWGLCWRNFNSFAGLLVEGSLLKQEWVHDLGGLGRAS